MVCKKVPSAIIFLKLSRPVKNRRGQNIIFAKGIIKGNAHGNDHKEEKAQGKGKSKHDACCIFPVKQAANGFHVKPPVFGYLGIKDRFTMGSGREDRPEL